MSMTTMQGAVGLLAFFAIAWLISERRRDVRIAEVFLAIALQLVLGALLLHIDALRALVAQLNHVVFALEQATQAGTILLFGFLGGAPLPYQEVSVGGSYVLAFRALPLLILMSALAALLTHWRVLPFLIGVLARALRRVMGLGNAVGFGVAANLLLGMVEAPLMIAAHLASMRRSDLFVLMSTGMATIAGTVWAFYANVLADSVPDAAGHLLVASVLSLPAAVGIARVMVPERPDDEAVREHAPTQQSRYTSTMDAITSGTQSGVQLFVNVAGMLLVLVALVHLLNLILGQLPLITGEALSLERILGYLLWPLAWLMGVPASEAATAASLLGTKTVLNELLAYLELSRLPGGALSEHSRVVMTYALCGFANPGSLGILIAGLSTIAPTRRHEIVALAPKSLIAGTLATCSTAATVTVVGPF